MNSSFGITQYMGRQVMLISFCLMVGYSFSIYTVYQWGVDDTVHYYMSLDSDALAQSPTPERVLTGYEDRLFFTPSNVPEKYKELVDFKNVALGDMLVHYIQNQTLYLMPFALNESSKEVGYLMHTYDEAQDDYQVSLEISDLLMLLALVSLLVIFALVNMLGSKITQPILELASWAKDLSKHDVDVHRAIKLPESTLKFKELTEVAHALSEAVLSIHQSTQREKQFLKALSHELRTPLAISKMALSLLNRSVSLFSEPDRQKLKKIERANQTMISTADSLLWLWGDKSQAIAEESIDLQQLITKQVSDNQYLLTGKKVSISIHGEQNKCLVVPNQLAEMVLRNLIRNSFQYTSDQGSVAILYSNEHVEINNSFVNEQAARKNSTQENNKDYGYGVGVFLVETICKEQGWPFQVSPTQYDYKVAIRFKC
ncbi:HAMP domain-containing sensor histidine kinase [Litoribacillus peritrichatus]|uniref:histidine kinase n=1 Tax=Litoribacillus peritrichatus TaxID=718191 RepID=A0ABP7M972_9GAMM